MKIFSQIRALVSRKCLEPDGRDRVQPAVELLENRTLCSATLHAKVKPPVYVNGSHTYSDGTFKNTNWTAAPVTYGAGGVSTGFQEKKGGSPGAYRFVTDTDYSGDDNTGVFGFHGNTKAIFNPAKQGAITQLNYSERNRLIYGFGQGERTGPALEQNGQIYFLLDQFLIIPQYKWAVLKVPKLTAADFSTLISGTHPDFSQAGAPIEFGFYRANTSGEGGYTIEAGIDDWSMNVRTRRLK